MVLTLKQARRMAEKTQSEAAHALGVSEKTYRKIEKNPEIATIKQAKTLASYFGYPYDSISFATHSN